MDPRLASSLVEIRDEMYAAVQIPYEGTLRAAAATVANAPTHSINATRVVGVLGSEDLSAFEVFVARLVEGYGIEASVCVEDGTFAVRFSRPTGDS